jgi:predicted aspartyl protease
MKNPPFNKQNLFLHGPVFEGEVYANEHSFLSHKNQRRVEPYAPVRLLIDTGSNISGLDYRIIDKLKLPKYESPAEVDGVGGIHRVGLYRCVLFLSIFGMKGLPLDVVAGDYHNSPYNGVIGRDVLQYCRFTFDGPGNSFALEAIDF